MRPRAALVFALVAAAAASANAQWRNARTGAPLEPGIYGRMELKGPVRPPLINREPVVASFAQARDGLQPVYLYVPPGQVRKWDLYCVKWQACDTPVYFVRVDDSPSRFGQWKRLRDERHARVEPGAAGQ